MGISKTSMLKFRKIFIVAMIMFVTISFSLNSVNAKEIENDKSSDNNVGEILTGKRCKKNMYKQLKIIIALKNLLYQES
ncbi:hypothetical protein RCO48_19560 [Peribacillus frigoritolerans]|nr:hypothetical protein [Peribacillus frigoritolerans]